MREWTPQLRRAGGGRREDEPLLVTADPAGTASRPPRVQGGQTDLVESVDHVPYGVLVGGDQPGDRRHRRATRRRHDDRRPADPHRAVLASPHDPLQPLALLIGQPPRPDPLSHPPRLTPRQRPRSPPQDETSPTDPPAPPAHHQPGKRSWPPH